MQEEMLFVDMQVSVIIPVYNAEKYIRAAVESALAQPETGEAILIEDASPDNSLQVCRELAEQYEKARLLRHPDGRNHGAGASRNVGIRNAQFDYIAFLDADDYFLPDRFSVSKELFEADPSIEGVYEAVGVHCENEAAEQRWREQRGARMLMTVTERVPPERLFEAQFPIGGSGHHAHTDGWVVKRAVFEKTELFDEHLRLHQDTAMFVRFAAVGKMVPGRLDEPVAMCRVHDQNRIFAPRSAAEQYSNRILMWSALWRWGKKNLNGGRQQLVTRRFLGYAARPYHNHKTGIQNCLQSSWQLVRLLSQYPNLLTDSYFWLNLLSKFRPPRTIRAKVVDYACALLTIGNQAIRRFETRKGGH